MESGLKYGAIRTYSKATCAYLDKSLFFRLSDIETLYVSRLQVASQERDLGFAESGKARHSKQTTFGPAENPPSAQSENATVWKEYVGNAGNDQKRKSSKPLSNVRF
jgi:hypothetical protein